MDFTKGKWEARNVPSAGWEIFAEVNMGKDENGGVLQPIYNVDIKPSLSVGDDGKVYAMIAYESWRQFPSIKFQKMQEANAQLIATAPKLYEALKHIIAYAEELRASMDAELSTPEVGTQTAETYLQQMSAGYKALAKVEGK